MRTGNKCYRKKSKNKKVRNNEIIRGKAKIGEEGSFKGAYRKAWFYVGRASNDSNPTKLIDYLVSLFPGVQFEVEELQKHSSNMSQNKSFKLGCDYSMLDKIKNPETWPENIVIRPFRFFRGTRTEEAIKFQ